MLFSVADLFSLSRSSRPTASQAESGSSFFSHFQSSFLSLEELFHHNFHQLL